MRSFADSRPKMARRRLPPTKAPKVISSSCGWIPAAAFVIKWHSNPRRGECYMRFPLLINLQTTLPKSVVAATLALRSNRAVDLRAIGIVRETRFMSRRAGKLHASEFGLAQDAHEQNLMRKRLSTGTLLFNAIPCEMSGLYGGPAGKPLRVPDNRAGKHVLCSTFTKLVPCLWNGTRLCVISIRMPLFTSSEVALQSARRESRAARLGLGAGPLA